MTDQEERNGRKLAGVLLIGIGIAVGVRLFGGDEEGDQVPGGKPNDGRYRLFVTGGGGQHSPVTPISPIIVVWNGTEVDTEVAVLIDVKQSRETVWIRTSRSASFDLLPNYKDEFTAPAFGIEDQPRFKGAWDLRARMWDDSGNVIAETVKSSFFRIQ